MSEFVSFKRKFIEGCASHLEWLGDPISTARAKELRAVLAQEAGKCNGSINNSVPTAAEYCDQLTQAINTWPDLGKIEKESGKFDPVAWGDLDPDICDQDRMLITDKDAADIYGRQYYKLTALYTSQPAPVSVPEIVELIAAVEGAIGAADMFSRAWEFNNDDGGEWAEKVCACLDKVKELNQ